MVELGLAGREVSRGHIVAMCGRNWSAIQCSGLATFTGVGMLRQVVAGYCGGVASEGVGPRVP
jgi:hypothetical protein